MSDSKNASPMLEMVMQGYTATLLAAIMATSRSGCVPQETAAAAAAGPNHIWPCSDCFLKSHCGSGHSLEFFGSLPCTQVAQRPFSSGRPNRPRNYTSRVREEEKIRTNYAPALGPT